MLLNECGLPSASWTCSSAISSNCAAVGIVSVTGAFLLVSPQPQSSLVDFGGGAGLDSSFGGGTGSSFGGGEGGAVVSFATPGVAAFPSLVFSAVLGAAIVVDGISVSSGDAMML